MEFLQKYYFSLSPLFVCNVVGRSMEPTIPRGAKVLVIKKWFSPSSIQDLVVVRHPQNNELLIKRVQKVNKEKIFVVGDNKNESTDSRDFGWIDKKNIMGKVIKIFS